MIENPLFTRQIDIDPAAFQGITPDKLDSWSEVILWCSINGVEVNYEIFKFILVGSVLFDNIYKLIINEMQSNKDFLT